jgi:hypothetical protein
MGFWTDHFGAHAAEPSAYYGPFRLLGVLMFLATASIPLIARLGGAVAGAIEPIREIAPATMEPVM